MSAVPPGSPPPEDQRAEVLDLIAVAIAVVLLLMVLASWPGALRVLFTALFTFFVPGRAVVSNWPRMAGWADLAMCVAISLGVLTLLALVSLWLRAWNPEGLFAVVALASLGALTAGIVRRRRSYWE